MRSTTHAHSSDRRATPRRLVPRPAAPPALTPETDADTDAETDADDLNPRAQAIVNYLMVCSPEDYAIALVIIDILPDTPRSYCLDDLLADIEKARPLLEAAA